MPFFQTNPPPPDYVAKDEIAKWRARPLESRQPGYYVWQAMCGLISWDKIATYADFESCKRAQFTLEHHRSYSCKPESATSALPPGAPPPARPSGGSVTRCKPWAAHKRLASSA